MASVAAQKYHLQHGSTGPRLKQPGRFFAHQCCSVHPDGENADQSWRHQHIRNGSSDLHMQMQEIVDTDLQKQRVRQHANLAAKVADLEVERRRAQDELEDTKQLHRGLMEEAHIQLSQAQRDQENIQYDIAHLKRVIEEQQNCAGQDVTRHEGEVTDRLLVLSAEKQHLTELHKNHTAEHEVTHDNISSLRRRAEDLHAEQEGANRRVTDAIDELQTWVSCITDAKSQLQEAECSRGCLRESYLRAGGQFEEAVGASQRHNRALAAELRTEVKRFQERSERYQRRFEASEAEIRFAEAAIQAQRLVATTRRTEFQFQQAQRASRTYPHINAACGISSEGLVLSQVSGPLVQDSSQSSTISVAQHQSLLQRHAESFCGHMRELEQRLRHEMAAGMARGSKDPQFSTQNNQHSDDDVERRSRGMRLQAMEEELLEVQRKHTNLELMAQMTEKQGDASYERVLELAPQHSRFQMMRENELQAIQEVCAQAEQVRVGTTDIQQRLASQKSTHHALSSDVADLKRLQDVLDEQAKQLSMAEQCRAEMKHRCENHQFELRSLDKHCATLRLRLSSTERHVAQVQEQKEHDLASYMASQKVAGRLECLLNQHIGREHDQVQKLLTATKMELDQMQNDCLRKFHHCMQKSVDNRGRARRWRPAVTGLATQSAEPEHQLCLWSNEAYAMESELGAMEEEEVVLRQTTAWAQQEQNRQLHAAKVVFSAAAMAIADEMGYETGNICGPSDNTSFGLPHHLKSELSRLIDHYREESLTEYQRTLEIAAVGSVPFHMCETRLSSEFARCRDNLQRERHRLSEQEASLEKLVCRSQELQVGPKESTSTKSPVLRGEFQGLLQKICTLQEEFTGEIAEQDRSERACHLANANRIWEMEARLRETLDLQRDALNASSRQGDVSLVSHQQARVNSDLLAMKTDALRKHRVMHSILQNECEAAIQQEILNRSALDVVERRLEESQEMRQQEIDQFEKRLKGRQKRQAQDIQHLKQLTAERVSQSRLFWEQSLTTVSSIMADSADNGAAHTADVTTFSCMNQE